jgi:hypothetical protein
MKGLGGVLAVTTNGRLDGLGRPSLPRRDILSRECTLQLEKKYCQCLVKHKVILKFVLSAGSAGPFAQCGRWTA